MPPRHTYWTIILEGKPTAFRAHTKEELLPTLRQLQARHPDAVMLWFARGRLWQSPEQALEALRARRPRDEHRGPGWRPGGSHQDPRERFKVPRDEKRRRFRDRMFRDRSEQGEEPRQRPEWKPQRRGGKGGAGEREWKPGRPSGSGGGTRDWRAGRPAGRPKRGPRGPETGGKSQGGTRGWSPDRRRSGPPESRRGPGRKPGGGGRRGGGGGGGSAQ
jgi:hypothetical protein